MKMVPSQLFDSHGSAELAVFTLLKRIDFGQSAVALHSLNLPLHQYKRWAEADFIIVSEKGLLLLEIKGGGVACKDGIWEYTNRFGEVNRKSESPATQAKTAFFSLRDNYLRPRFTSVLNSVPQGWGVVFTGIDRLVSKGRSSLPEQPDDITAYRPDCIGHNTFRDYLERLTNYWAERTGKAGHISSGTAKEIVSYLRPNFEQVPPLANRLDQFGQDLAAFTEEQYARLDDIQENDRIVIRGGAGTGKTFLAMASARYDCAQGHEVLLTTRSRHLVGELKASSPPAGVDIVAYDDISNALLVRGKEWSSLVIDEGQDLCQFDALDLLGRTLKGGMESGRWRWFGDPNRQVSESFPLDEDALGYIFELGTKCKLKHNIRNAPKIVEAIERYVGADIGAPSPIGHGSEVIVRECKSGNDLPAAVVAVLRSWVAGQDGAKRSDIAVLVSNETQTSAIIESLAAAGIRAERLVVRSDGKIRNSVAVALIEEFKGLERPLVCVAGLGNATLEDAIRSIVYRCFSRANHTLALCCTATESSRLAEVAVALLTQKNNSGE